MELSSSVPQLDSATEVARYARNALRNADALGVLPTPIDDLLSAAKIGNLRIDDGSKERFLSRLQGSARDTFSSIFQKVRGIADLRERVVYVDNGLTSPRIRFTKGHELGHEVLPWQKLDPGFFDDDKSLRCDIEEDFDIEANFFSAEVIFQGDRFTKIVRDYAPGFQSLFHIAQLHGASRHATLWRYAEVQDETIALVTYWPSQYQRQILRRGKVVVSPSFRKKYQDIAVPQQLLESHPWASAWHSGLVQRETISLDCDGTSHHFEWEAWWNRYALFVLLRRKPLLSIVKSLAELSLVSR